MLFEYTLHCAICSSPPTITWLLSNSLDYATFFMTKLLKNYQYLWLILSVQFSSVAQSCPTLCSPMDCSTPGFPVRHQLPELVQTHVRGVGDAIQPYHPVGPFSSCLLSFPASGSFQMSQFFASGDQSIEVSASVSVLPMNIQDWFPLGLTSWISLQSSGFSRVFFNTTIQKDQFFGAQLIYGPTLTSRHDYWKNHSFGYMDLHRQNDDSAFKYAV